MLTRAQVHVDVDVWLWNDGHKPSSVEERKRERSAEPKDPESGSLRTWGWLCERYREKEREMARSAIQRLVPYLVGRVRENQRLLSSASSSSAVYELPPSSSSSSASPSLDSLHLTESCVRRMKELQASEASADNRMLRLSVETGGCSGFQYVFDLDDKTNSDDRVFEKEGVKLVIDNISYDFVKGATVDYVEELIRSAFVVTENPSAVGGCSCKSSFMVKQ